jgi:hypothetical protein
VHHKVTVPLLASPWRTGRPGALIPVALACIVCFWHTPLSRHRCAGSRRAGARSRRCHIAFLLRQRPASGRRALDGAAPLSAW